MDRKQIKFGSHEIAVAVKKSHQNEFVCINKRNYDNQILLNILIRIDAKFLFLLKPLHRSFLFRIRKLYEVLFLLVLSFILTLKLNTNTIKFEPEV